MFDGEKLHEYGKLYNWALGRLERSNLTEKEKEFVKQFCDEKLGNGISKARIIRYINNFVWIRQLLPRSLLDAEKSDLIKLLKKIELTDFADSTKADLKRTLKTFFQWNAGMTDDEFPDIVKWIKVASKYRYKTAEEIPTLEELLRIQSYITNYRDKALYWVALESGARPSGILSPQLKDVKIERDFIRITTRDKKGECYMWIIVARRFLLMWLENHPLKDDPEAPLWVNMEGATKYNVLKWRTFRQIIQKYAKRAGVRKRIYPYLFRHRDASWKSDWMNEQQLAQDKGWVQGSDMPRIYIHRNINRQRDALLKHHGIETPPNLEELNVKKCARCDERNPPVANYCLRCGWNLNEEKEAGQKNSGIVHTQAI